MWKKAEEGDTPGALTPGEDDVRPQVELDARAAIRRHYEEEADRLQAKICDLKLRDESAETREEFLGC